MLNHPRHYALYRRSDGTETIMHHYHDDTETFTDHEGATWTRIAVTERPVYTGEEARRQFSAAIVQAGKE